VKETEAIVNIIPGDKRGVVNVLESHPSLPVIATSGMISIATVAEDERGVVNVLDNHPSLPVLATSGMTSFVR
jgi:hypothetical protein